jgi:hypothetical protein
MDNNIQLAPSRADGDTLCRTCYWAHIQRGFRESEEEVFCAFGVDLRILRFKVRDCTDYLNKNLPSRRQMEDIALIIPTQPVRRPAGFGVAATGYDSDPGEEELGSASPSSSLSVYRK